MPRRRSRPAPSVARSTRTPAGIGTILIALVIGCCALGFLPRLGADLATQAQQAARGAPSPVMARSPELPPSPLAATASDPTPTDRPTPSPVPPMATPTPTFPPSPVPTELPTPIPPPAIGVACLDGLTWEAATLVRVIDGDTIDVRLADGRTERVRYIGINTPERGEQFADNATYANRSLIEARPLLLARDVSERDRYDRLLRYVVAGDVFVNLALVEQGLAQVATYPPDVRCVDAYLAAQQRAREQGAGLWAIWGPAPAAQPTAPAPTAQPTQPPVPPPAAAGQCHPAYPTVCIPPPPPDLSCRDIPYRRFRVDWTYGDPHGFDRDRDGIGCES